jgi:hypothetical protein
MSQFAVKWVFRLDEDYVYNLRHYLPPGWNDIVIGTPDGIPNEKTGKPKAYYASLLHDVLYQFLDVDLPLSRAQIDHVFLDVLTRDCFAPRWLYYAAVRCFGGLFRCFTHWKRSYAGTRVPL